MVTAVCKYALSDGPGTTTHLMPIGARVLGVESVQSRPVIWARVDPTAEKVDRTFEVAETDALLPDGPLDYIGTAQLYGGSYVLHVFEVQQ